MTEHAPPRPDDYYKLHFDDSDKWTIWVEDAGRYMEYQDTHIEHLEAEIERLKAEAPLPPCLKRGTHGNCLLYGNGHHPCREVRIKGLCEGPGIEPPAEEPETEGGA